MLPPILALARRFKLGGALGNGLWRECGARFPIDWGKQAGNRLARNLFGDVAEDVFGALIPAGDYVFEILADYGVGVEADNGCEETVSFVCSPFVSQLGLERRGKLEALVFAIIDVLSCKVGCFGDEVRFSQAQLTCSWYNSLTDGFYVRYELVLC